MEEYDVPSAASILASVKEQEARFERLTRALEEERRNVSLQLERGSLPSDRLVGGTTGGSNQPLAWQQMVMQVNYSRLASHASVYVNEQSSPQPPFMLMMLHVYCFHKISPSVSHSACAVFGCAEVLSCSDSSSILRMSCLYTLLSSHLSPPRAYSYYLIDLHVCFGSFMVLRQMCVWGSDVTRMQFWGKLKSVWEDINVKWN